MAKPRPTITKRLREKAKMEKAERKVARKAQRDADRPPSPENPDGIDPDIEHIVPGPQPPVWSDGSC